MLVWVVWAIGLPSSGQAVIASRPQAGAAISRRMRISDRDCFVAAFLAMTRVAGYRLDKLRIAAT